MMRTLVALLVVAFTEAFIFPSITGRHSTTVLATRSGDDLEQTYQYSSEGIHTSRRNLFHTVVLGSLSLALQPQLVRAASNKVLVLGGTGFVGSRIVATLKDLGVDVVATSTDGRDGTVALDVTSADTKDLVTKAAAGCSAVISCIGVVGTENDKIVNAATALAAEGAKAAGVERFVYITVAPEVKEFAKDIDFLKGYMEGKTISRDAVLAQFGSKATLIEPTFIYGGGSFELNPPRVSSFYGQFIEGLLSSSPVRSVERIMSPGIIKIALEPPVPVEVVAAAAIAGALGKAEPILDTYDSIKSAAKLVEVPAS